MPPFAIGSQDEELGTSALVQEKLLEDDPEDFSDPGDDDEDEEIDEDVSAVHKEWKIERRACRWTLTVIVFPTVFLGGRGRRSRRRIRPRRRRGR